MTIIVQSAGGVVLNSKGEVLVVSQQGTSWSLPKGHVEEGETALEAAQREVYEETGVSGLELVRELGTIERYKGAPDGGDDTSEWKIIRIFLFKADSETLKPIDPANPEARWIPKEEVATVLTYLKDREFFLRIKGEI